MGQFFKEDLMCPDRRQFLSGAGAAAALCAIPAMAGPQAYPTRPIRMIVPFPAGGPADLLARIVAQNLPEAWKVYIDNVAGASGNIGIRTAAKAAADGHTVLIVTGSFAINPSLFRRIPYDPVRDFAPVTLAVASSHVLVVHPKIPARDVRELIALIKANPGKYSYASPGKGQSAQLAGELFKLATGLTDLTHVPFSGAAPAVISTIGGHTPIAFLALPGAASNIKDGTLRALVVTGSKRAEAFPDIPTIAEAGWPDQESIFPQGILAPAGTPRSIIDLWHTEVGRILAIPAVRQRLAGFSFEVVANAPDEFGSWIKNEMMRWARVIRDAKIEPIE